MQKEKGINKRVESNKAVRNLRNFSSHPAFGLYLINIYAGIRAKLNSFFLLFTFIFAKFSRPLDFPGSQKELKEHENRRDVLNVKNNH